MTLLSEPFSARRSIYGFIDRQNLPGLFRTFDFVAPDSSAPQRMQTTVPQQALFLLNSSFIQQQATALAYRVSSRKSPSDSVDIEQRIQEIYESIFSRRAMPDELQIGKHFVTDQQHEGSSTTASSPAGEFIAWQEYVQALLLSNEFVFID